MFPVGNLLMFWISKVQRGSRSCPCSRIKPSLVVMSRLLQFVSGAFIVCRKSTPPLGQMESREEIPRLVFKHLSIYLPVHPITYLRFELLKLISHCCFLVKWTKFRSMLFWTSWITIKSMGCRVSHLFPSFIPIRTDPDHNLAVLSTILHSIVNNQEWKGQNCVHECKKVHIFPSPSSRSKTISSSPTCKCQWALTGLQICAFPTLAPPDAAS